MPLFRLNLTQLTLCYSNCFKEFLFNFKIVNGNVACHIVTTQYAFNVLVVAAFHLPWVCPAWSA